MHLVFSFSFYSSGSVCPYVHVNLDRFFICETQKDKTSSSIV